jgi:hypothetical protein
MTVKLRLDANLYRNTGTFSVPVWKEGNNVTDATFKPRAGEADVTTRGRARWRATIDTLKDGSRKFEMVWDTADDEFGAIRDGFSNGRSTEFAILDGDIALSGARGLRATCIVTNFSRNKPLEERITVSVAAKPTYSANPPSGVVGP